MLVTTIAELDKKRSLVTLDNEFSFVLYKGELRLYKVKENSEISPDVYREIIEVVLPKRAKLRAMNLLKVRPYTYKGLSQKLKDGQYPDNIIKIAMDYVCSYGYVNDEEYVRQYVTTYMDRKNKARMRQDLLTKGAPKDIIDNVMSEIFEEADCDYEIEQIKAYLIKKHFDPDNSSYEERMKLLSALCRKGYSIEKCKRAIGSLEDSFT